MHKIAIAIWTADAIAILYGGYHYWAFYKKFEQARMEGKIPIDLQSQRMGIVWMIASPGVVPDGAFHRRKAMYGLGVLSRPRGSFKSCAAPTQHCGAAVGPQGSGWLSYDPWRAVCYGQFLLARQYWPFCR